MVKRVLATEPPCTASMAKSENGEVVPTPTREAKVLKPVVEVATR